MSNMFSKHLNYSVGILIVVSGAKQ